MASSSSLNHVLTDGVHEIKLGKTFRNYHKGGGDAFNDTETFHSLRYDFKPASIDPNSVATIAFEPQSKGQVTVTAPGMDGGQTVFKGSAKPSERECVLIIDHETGELTLERLSAAIQVKKTREEKVDRSNGKQSGGGSLLDRSMPSNQSQASSSDYSPKVANSSSDRERDRDHGQTFSSTSNLHSMPTFNGTTTIRTTYEHTVSNATHNTMTTETISSKMETLSGSDSSSSGSSSDSSSGSSSSGDSDSSSSDEDDEAAKKLEDLI